MTYCEKCVILNKKGENCKMALIICPECNKQVSDKAQSCIHCGYPLQKQINTVCIIKGQPYDFSCVLNAMLNNGEDQIAISKIILQKTSLQMSDGLKLGSMIYNTKKIPQTYAPERPLKTELEDNVPKCPYCKSKDLTKITTASRSISVGLFGFGSSKVGKQWHCNKCKSDF